MSNVYTISNFIDFCDSIFGGCHLTNGSDNINTICPICRKEKGLNYNKRKLVIHSSKHYLHCWVCGYKSKNLLHLLKGFCRYRVQEYIDNFLSAENISAAENIPKIIKVSLPKDFQLLALMDKEDAVALSARDYLAARGIDSISDLWYWRFGISKSLTRLSGRIIMPSFDRYGNLNYFTARLFVDRNEQKYENPEVSREDIIFNELNIDWSKELTITEGPFDLLKCNSNATSLLGSSFNTDYKLFEQIVINKTPVLLALDNDATGRHKSKKIASLLDSYGISIRILSYEHKQIPIYEDVGSMTKKHFNLLHSSAKIYSKESNLMEKIQNIV